MCGPFLSADGGLRHVVFCSVEWLQMTNMATMYALKPIYDDKIDLQLPNCMYKMDNVNKSRQTQMEAPVSDDDDNPLSALERRQDRILQQLEKLKSEVNNLLEKSENQKSMDVKQETPCTAVKMDVTYHDIVINANPKRPPLSLFVLHRLLTPKVQCFTSVFVHSSVTTADDTLKQSLLNGSQDRSNAQLVFTLIWKDVCQPEMNIQPVSQSPIHGEANIARYLSRLLDSNYEANPEVATQIDTWLDIATNSVLNGASKEKASVLRSLNSHLGKNPWLVGSSLSLADIIMWSSLNQSGQANGAPGNVKKWLKACEDISAFQFAKTVN